MNDEKNVERASQEQRFYTVAELFQGCNESFSAYELYTHEDGKEDLKILAANKTFADLIGINYNELIGQLFTDACPMALDWLPFYIQIAKSGKESLHESYNQDLKKYLSALVFSPKVGEVAIFIIDRTSLWKNEQIIREKNQDLTAIFSSMTIGFCFGRLIRDEQGQAVDILYEMVNASFEILEGFPTATLAGKHLRDVYEDDPHFELYVDVVDNQKKVVFTKHVALNDFILEITCFSQTKDTIVFIETDVTEKEKANKELHLAYQKIAEQNETILASINYASKIQKNLLPKQDEFERAFSDHSILWKPRDIVGGDIYWLKNFQEGALLCVCDCTGHGTPGALLTMLVTSIFEDSVTDENCRDTAQILYLLDRRFVSLLKVSDASGEGRGMMEFNDGCDVAALFIGKDGSVNISSANMPIIICDGEETHKLRGQKLYIGNGAIAGKEDIVMITIPPNPKQTFYIASDGIYDQIGGENRRPFGYKMFQELILAHHEKSQADISSALWEMFEAFRGEQERRDDVQIISFKI